MTLEKIATVSGKGGLYKVVAPTKSGVILEAMDETHAKMIATTNHRLSLLNEISIYTTTKEGTVPLEDVLRKINKDFADDLGVDANADASELKAFLKSILPEYDEDRVYVSDIKKLVKWYELIRKHAPEFFTSEKAEKKSEEGSDVKNESSKGETAEPTTEKTKKKKA